MHTLANVSNRDAIVRRYKQVRAATESFCACLEPEDYVVQPIVDVSPPKWHLAHTAWFFERAILAEHSPNYRPFNEKYFFLFNSYYQSFGDRGARDCRGSFSRPTVAEVMEYRTVVDERIYKLVSSVSEIKFSVILPLLELGLHHEQQHQELLVTDTKYILGTNPLRPAYRRTPLKNDLSRKIPTLEYLEMMGGIVSIGDESSGFAWDNERPRHRVFLHPFKLANRLITCGEYLQFMSDNGYQRPLLWLSNGWDAVTNNSWRAPLYWEEQDREWFLYTLTGLRPLDLSEPVTHVSHFEADAFARWSGKRLATEFEWEYASQQSGAFHKANYFDSSVLHPQALSMDNSGSIAQLFGDCWEWTQSAYLPYPGYHQAEGALGEYNGKFMNAQMVLRGGSCATPADHMRPTYRNFFQSDKRWQFSGIRLAEDL